MVLKNQTMTKNIKGFRSKTYLKTKQQVSKKQNHHIKLNFMNWYRQNSKHTSLLNT